MVGLVIVSHSRDLAAGVAGLAASVSESAVPVAHAGGVGADRAELGTDATQIMEAIESVFSEDGVLVLMDLGSAILSTETALELLGEEYAGKIRVCPAPVVEGAVAAAVQIAVGSDLDTVASEALDALVPKRRQLGLDGPSGSGESLPAEAPTTGRVSEPIDAGRHEESTTRTYEIRTEHGLHARPAAKFVATISRFDAQVQVRNVTRNTGFVAATSLNRVALLSVASGDTIEVRADGADAHQVLSAIERLVTENFGERLVARTVVETADHREFSGTETGSIRSVGVSEGWAVGPLFFTDLTEPKVPDSAATDTDTELKQLDAARARVRNRLKEQARSLSERGLAEEAEILDAHQLILDDPDVDKKVRRMVGESGLNSARAYADAMQQLANEYSMNPDPYLRQRAADIFDVRMRVLVELLPHGGEETRGPARPSILYARELSPSQTADLDPSLILGIITEGGGPTSHAAILARALGIPAVAGSKIEPAAIPAPVSAALDGNTGEVVVNPDAATESHYRAQRDVWQRRRTELRERSAGPACTTDGRNIVVLANVGDSAGSDEVNSNGGEGVGLLRTEFLFLSRRRAPSEREQVDLLSRVFDSVGKKPITVRTLDVGGDKVLPFLSQKREENPFLGVRGVRLCLRERALFKEHLRAILQAGTGRDLRIMLPMVAQIEEIESARELLFEAAGELRNEGVDVGDIPPLGIMIETPAAVLHASRMTEHAAFFSIGTNDLTQYVMAAERGNDALVHIADPCHPAVLRAIRSSVEAADGAGIDVSVCGEAAAIPETAVLLVGLGIRKLSMSPGAIPSMKDLLRRISYVDARNLAHDALNFEGASPVRTVVTQYLSSIGW